MATPFTPQHTPFPFPSQATGEDLPSCTNEECLYPTRPHHHNEMGCFVHRHPGCPFDCGEVYSENVKGATQGQEATPNEASLPPSVEELRRYTQEAQETYSSLVRKQEEEAEEELQRGFEQGVSIINARLHDLMETKPFVYDSKNPVMPTSEQVFILSPTVGKAFSPLKAYYEEKGFKVTRKVNAGASLTLTLSWGE